VVRHYELSEGDVSVGGLPFLLMVDLLFLPRLSSTAFQP
jgi:hypothetical protein